MGIKIPDCLSRTPKGLDDIGHWKGIIMQVHLYVGQHDGVCSRTCTPTCTCTYCVCTFTYAVYPVQVLSVVFSASSELRNWLLYYSILVLAGILPEKYLSHYAHLVASILHLTAERITKLDLEKARSSLAYFYRSFHNLHGNMHKHTCT